MVLEVEAALLFRECVWDALIVRFDCHESSWGAMASVFGGCNWLVEWAAFSGAV